MKIDMGSRRELGQWPVATANQLNADDSLCLHFDFPNPDVQQLRHQHPSVDRGNIIM